MENEESSRLLENSADYRTCSIAKNSERYVPGKEYLPTTPDTISDGDNRGRDPENDGNSIGTNIDIKMRESLLAKNSDGYTTGSEYCAGNADTIADGDEKGREPEDPSLDAGTCIDFTNRDCMLAKNSGLYTKNRQYGFGNGTV